MGKGSTQTKSNQTQTQQGTSTTNLPSWVTTTAQNNLNFANNVASDYAPVYQATPAGFTSDQWTAFNLINQAAQQNPAQAADQYALNQTQTAGNWTPSTIAASPYQAANVTTPGGYVPQNVAASGYSAVNAAPAVGYNAVTGQASQINPNSISQVQGQNTLNNLSAYEQGFQNPYEQNVVNTSLQQLDLARQLTEQQTAAQAAQAGAFGSSRQGVADALTNNNFANQAANMVANLNLQGFNTGLSALQSDEATQQQAALANQAVQQNTAQQNAQLGQGMTLANIGYGNQANQFLANAQNQFSLADQAAQNQAAQFGASQQQNAALANQQAQAAAAQFGLGQQMQGGLANQASQNAASQFNLGQNLQAQLANQSAGQSQAQNMLASGAQAANIGGQQLNNALTAANALNTTGTQQQAYNQSMLNNAYQNALANQQNPLMQLAILQQALQSTPYGTTTTQSGTSTGQGVTTQGQVPGIWNMIGSGLQLASLIPGLSDMRLKTNLAPPMRDPLKAVRKIKPASYEWKPGVGPPGRQMGLIAQNVEQAAPEAVNTDPMTGMKSINHPAMMGLLTGAIHAIDRKVSARKKGVIPSAATRTL